MATSTKKEKRATRKAGIDKLLKSTRVTSPGKAAYKKKLDEMFDTINEQIDKYNNLKSAAVELGVAKSGELRDVADMEYNGSGAGAKYWGVSSAITKLLTAQPNVITDFDLDTLRKALPKQFRDAPDGTLINALNYLRGKFPPSGNGATVSLLGMPGTYGIALGAYTNEYRFFNYTLLTISKGVL